MTEKQLRKKAMALPLHPGVYIMKNKDKKINSNCKQNVHEFYTYDGVHS